MYIHLILSLSTSLIHTLQACTFSKISTTSKHMYLQMYYSLRVCVRNKRLASNNSQKHIHILMTHKQLSYNHLEIPEIFPSSCAKLLMDYVFFIMCIQIYKYTYEHCWVMRRRIENLKIHATCCRDLYACWMPRRWSCSNYATAVKENIHNTCKEIYKQI